jgi:hypothetical protein
VRLEFDMAIALDGASEARRWRGFPSGFELGDSTGTQWQTMTLLGVRGAGNMTVQLNATFAPFGGERHTRLFSSRRFLTVQYEKRSIAETHSGQTYRQGKLKTLRVVFSQRQTAASFFQTRSRGSYDMRGMTTLRCSCIARRRAGR